VTGSKRFIASEEAAKRGPYDEYPMLPPEIDPQVHLSRNDRPQPFHLICEHDCVLITMTGEGTVHFAEGAVRFWPVESGDFVYVPAGIPHRMVPTRECVQLRYKAAKPGLEAVCWYCDQCGSELHRHVWDTAEQLPQEGYQLACSNHNADADLRRCGTCGHANPTIDLSQFRWAEVAAELRASMASS